MTAGGTVPERRPGWACAPGVSSDAAPLMWLRLSLVIIAVMVSGCSLRQAPGLMIGGGGRVMAAKPEAAREEQERLLTQGILAITSDDWLVEITIDRNPRINPRAAFADRWWWESALVAVRLAPVVPDPEAYDTAAITSSVQEEMHPRVTAGGRLRVVVEELLPRLRPEAVRRPRR